MKDYKKGENDQQLLYLQIAIGVLALCLVFIIAFLCAKKQIASKNSQNVFGAD
jgi:hypothetical protein